MLQNPCPADLSPNAFNSRTLRPINCARRSLIERRGIGRDLLKPIFEVEPLRRGLRLKLRCLPFRKVNLYGRYEKSPFLSGHSKCILLSRADNARRAVTDEEIALPVKRGFVDFEIAQERESTPSPAVYSRGRGQTRDTPDRA